MDFSLSRLFLKIFTQEEKIKLAGFNFLNFIFNALDIGFLGILLWIINFYANPKSISFQIPFIDQSSNPHSLNLLGIFLVLFISKNILGYYLTLKRDQFFFTISTRISEQNLSQYLHQDYSSYVMEDSSIQIRRINHEPIEFITYILMNIQEVITQSLTIFFTLIGIILYKPFLFLGLFVLLLPPLILVNYISRKKLHDLRKGIKLFSEKSIQTLREALDSFIVSNIDGKKMFFKNRYLPFQKELNGFIALQQSLQGLPIRFLEIFAVFGYFILQWIFSWAKSTAANPILDTGILLTASYKIIPGIVRIMNSSSQIKTYQFTIEDLSKQNFGKPEDEVISKSHLESIELRDLDFQYGNQIILKKLSFTLESGNFLVITGRSGTGKTTLINLILGFLNPEKGHILFNQVITQSETRKRFWPQIAYIKQEPFIIQDTLEKNIILSEKKTDPFRLKKIIEFCELQDFIQKLDQGLETLIMENGKNLSGGQKQRIMLARALYRDFDLLILDEALSEIDEESSRIILNNLKTLCLGGKMILFITHNPKHFDFGHKFMKLNDQ